MTEEPRDPMLYTLQWVVASGRGKGERELVCSRCQGVRLTLADYVVTCGCCGTVHRKLAELALRQIPA